MFPRAKKRIGKGIEKHFSLFLFFWEKGILIKRPASYVVHYIWWSLEVSCNVWSRIIEVEHLVNVQCLYADNKTCKVLVEQG